VDKRIFLTLPELELGALGHPARSQSLYRLRYPRWAHDCIHGGLRGNAVYIVYVWKLGPDVMSRRVQFN
jgi:hypothetical protein